MTLIDYFAAHALHCPLLGTAGWQPENEHELARMVYAIGSAMVKLKRQREG